MALQDAAADNVVTLAPANDDRAQASTQQLAA
jgi:hypothetical protein